MKLLKVIAQNKHVVGAHGVWKDQCKKGIQQSQVLNHQERGNQSSIEEHGEANHHGKN